MKRITAAWPEYFRNRNEGLGTTYERFILNRYFERIKGKYEIESVLETPSFGMTGISGINSIWWAVEEDRGQRTEGGGQRSVIRCPSGVRVTVVDNSEERIEFIKRVWEELSLEVIFVYDQSEYATLPFQDNSFDMGWNFAALGAVPGLEKFLNELTRVSRKIIFICIPNRLNLLNRLRAASERTHAVLYEQNMDPAKIKKIMSRLRWQVQEQGFFDVPPWPDIAMNKEDLLYNMGFKKLGDRLREGEGNSICILDYFKGKKKEMEREVLRYAFLEYSPMFFKKLWAHHQYFIFAPKKGTKRSRVKLQLD